jgi:hypothetical protein
MSEHPPLSPFEERVASELERYVAGVRDPRPAADIAARAMRPAGVRTRMRDRIRSRRLVIVGLAAALLIPAVTVGALILWPPMLDRSEVTSSGDLAILVRRIEDAEPGVAVVAVRPDGGERLLRRIPDALLGQGGSAGTWGIVSESGWLAFGTEAGDGPWLLILVDLADPSSEPWVIDEADLGGIGPVWGPTGLLAAVGGSRQDLVVVDPEAHAIRHVSMQGRGLVGGGPSIIWTADGAGFVATTRTRGYETVPLDGSDPVPGVTGVFEPRGAYGPDMAGLRTCSPGAGCTGGDDGRVERVHPDGSAETIWQQDGTDRALGARFAAAGDAYWLELDHDQGRQVALLRLRDGRQDAMVTINRDASWQSVGIAGESSDQAAVVLSVYPGGSVLVPLAPGTPPTLHDGSFAGYVRGPALAAVARGLHSSPAASMPVVGQAYALPDLDALIAAELALNPGRRVLGKASRDGSPEDGAIQTFEVTRDAVGAGEAYVDCIGPSNLTVRSGASSVTSPCLVAGAYVLSVGAAGPITVEASGDTSWRVVIYSP